jgi:hypothetical protein
MDPVDGAALPAELFQQLSEFPRELRFLARTFREIGRGLDEERDPPRNTRDGPAVRRAARWLSAP